MLYCFMFCGKDVKTTLEVSDRMYLAPSFLASWKHCQCSIVSCFVEKDEKTTLKVSDRMDLAPSPFWRVGPLSVIYCFHVLWKRRENNFGHKSVRLLERIHLPQGLFVRPLAYSQDWTRRWREGKQSRKTNSTLVETIKMRKNPVKTFRNQEKSMITVIGNEIKMLYTG